MKISDEVRKAAIEAAKDVRRRWKLSTKPLENGAVVRRVAAGGYDVAPALLAGGYAPVHVTEQEVRSKMREVKMGAPKRGERKRGNA